MLNSLIWSNHGFRVQRAGRTVLAGRVGEKKLGLEDLDKQRKGISIIRIRTHAESEGRSGSLT